MTDTDNSNKDAVLRDKTQLKAFIANAIKSYADSELCALHYHDPAMRETAHDAMHKLIKDSEKIAGYALSWHTRRPHPLQRLHMKEE